MKLIILGAPGAGKGTQARVLSKKFGLMHISTGDILRKHIAQKTQIGLEIEDMMKFGHLVPDEIVTNLVRECIRESSGDFILDGFPRTLKQAEILESIVKDIDKVISVDVPDNIIVERMSGRVVCPNCNKMYNYYYHPPKEKGFCDECQSNLMQREDDKARTVEKRLLLYHELTEPIISYYQKKELLLEVDGLQPIEDVTDFILKNLEVVSVDANYNKG